MAQEGLAWEGNQEARGMVNIAMNTGGRGCQWRNQRQTGVSSEW